MQLLVLDTGDGNVHKTTMCNIAVLHTLSEHVNKATGCNITVLYTFNENKHTTTGCNIAALNTLKGSVHKTTARYPAPEHMQVLQTTHINYNNTSNYDKQRNKARRTNSDASRKIACARDSLNYAQR